MLYKISHLYYIIQHPFWKSFLQLYLIQSHYTNFSTSQILNLIFIFKKDLIFYTLILTSFLTSADFTNAYHCVYERVHIEKCMANFHME